MHLNAIADLGLYVFVKISTKKSTKNANNNKVLNLYDQANNDLIKPASFSFMYFSISNFVDQCFVFMYIYLLI